MQPRILNPSLPSLPRTLATTTITSVVVGEVVGEGLVVSEVGVVDAAVEIMLTGTTPHRMRQPLTIAGQQIIAQASQPQTSNQALLLRT